MNFNEIFSAGKISTQFWKENKNVLKNVNDVNNINYILWVSNNSKNIIINLLSWHNLWDSFEFSEQFNDKKNIEYIWHSSDILKIFMDKFETKFLLKNKWFDVTNWFLIDFSENFKEKILSELKFPILIKEVDNLWGAWIDILKCDLDLEKFIFDKEKRYLAEEFISWEEYSWNIFSHKLNENDILWNKTVEIFPPIEKWETWISDDNKPKHSLNKVRKTFFDKDIEKEIRNISLEIWKIDWINWFLEIEFIYDKSDKKLKIIEVNPRPSWTLSMALESCDLRIKDFLNNLKNSSNCTNNLLQIKHCVEIPIVHDNPDFKSTDINIPSKSRIFSKKELRKFPPYAENYWIEFDEKGDAEEFIKNIKF